MLSRNLRYSLNENDDQMKEFNFERQTKVIQKPKRFQITKPKYCGTLTFSLD